MGRCASGIVYQYKSHEIKIEMDGMCAEYIKKNKCDKK